ncbi:hypothetical protein [Streptomyces sp. NPDC054786]
MARQTPHGHTAAARRARHSDGPDPGFPGIGAAALRRMTLAVPEGFRRTGRLSAQGARWFNRRFLKDR